MQIKLLNLLRHYWIMPGSPRCSHRLLVSTSDSHIIDRRIQLYLNRRLNTTSDQASHLSLLFHIPQNTGHFVISPCGTGKKKILCFRQNVLKKKHTHTQLNLGNVFYARKMVPSSQGSVFIYLINIQFESQPSVLKIIYEEAAKGQMWGETMGALLSTSRNFTFSSGELCEGQKRRLNKPLPSPPDCGKVRFHADFTALWVRSGITHQYASHQSCRT